ncbi:MAG: hypothetical protein C0594_12840 [Marinilabiliales bacterium]|nr:MAG: hypothetical protein C0594_12840 [Marinilabiliales bacterium]
MDKLFGCCNIYSTVQDLFLFYRSLVAGRLVSPAILEDALIPVELNDATQTNQAYGFEIIASNSGFAVYSEGDIPGNSTAILWKPKRNELIILCSNDNYPGLNYNNEIIKSVATILADGKLNIPRKSVCFEIMKNILVWSDKELENNFNSMVSNTKRYYLDKQELRNIGEKLKDKGEKDKADFLMNVAKKYSDQK